MWRNADVLDFVGWLRAHNDQFTGYSQKVGFYGLDLYSLYGSIQAVLKYLDRVDPQAASRARFRYGCFEDFAEDSQAYGYAARFDLSASCEQEVVAQLLELQQTALDYAQRDGRIVEDEQFFAEQNARVVKNAEEYYRSMFRGRVSSWNLRDQHMAGTLEALMDHLSRGGRQARMVVWAHNSHLGDARATEVAEQGEWNVGQLVRERFGSEAVLVGFSTYSGTVTAASNWDEPPASQAGPAGLARQLRGAVPRARAARLLLETARRRATAAAGAAPAPPGAGYRRGVSARDGAAQPLFPCASVGSVRRDHPLRPDTRSRTVGANGRLGGWRFA